MISTYGRDARRAAVGVATASLVLLFATAASAATCDSKPPAIKFIYETPAPTIDNTRPQPELQQMGQSTVTEHHEGRILGLYVAEMGYSEETKFTIKTTGNTACVAVDTVNVKFQLRNRRIYIVNDWKSGTCPYTAILGHERKHQETDEKIFRDKTPIAKRRIADALARASTAPVPTSQREAAQNRLQGQVEDVLKKFVTEMTQARTIAQHAIDAGREYQRVADSCTQFRRPV